MSQLLLDSETRERLRLALLSKGHQLATTLAEVLAGKNLDLSQLGDPRDSLFTKRPEERLRRFLDQVEARRRMLQANDPRYGHCDACGAPLGASALEQMPWADRCETCGAV